MRLLLDTHILIWWDSQPTRLTPNVSAALLDPANSLVLSTVSLWEIQIKHQLGKLTLSRSLDELVKAQQATNGLDLLDILPIHVYGLTALPALHKDPFDRLLVSQARVDGMTLVTADAVLETYPVSVIR